MEIDQGISGKIILKLKYALKVLAGFDGLRIGFNIRL
jgi:hypothetical protein